MVGLVSWDLDRFDVPEFLPLGRSADISYFGDIIAKGDCIMDLLGSSYKKIGTTHFPFGRWSGPGTVSVSQNHPWDTHLFGTHSQSDFLGIHKGRKASDEKI